MQVVTILMKRGTSAESGFNQTREEGMHIEHDTKKIRYANN
jgi:hypothetical protein